MCKRVRTSSELVLVGDVVLVQLGRLLLGLLVVNRVGTRWIILSALVGCAISLRDPASLRAEVFGAYLLVLKASWIYGMCYEVGSVAVRLGGK
jgi:hypothetical protein